MDNGQVFLNFSSGDTIYVYADNSGNDIYDTVRTAVSSNIRDLHDEEATASAILRALYSLEIVLNMFQLKISHKSTYAHHNVEVDLKSNFVVHYEKNYIEMGNLV